MKRIEEIISEISKLPLAEKVEAYHFKYNTLYKNGN